MKRQLSLALLGSVSLVACLDRPVENTSPVTSSTVAVKLAQEAVDKVDILFDIDNSASMGDKQAYLSKAIPDLITRLVTPNCVDANGDRRRPVGRLSGPARPRRRPSSRPCTTCTSAS